jgi:hypothetical protein
MRSRARVVVAQPLTVVESHLWDVGSWPAYLGRLDSAVRTKHERYTVQVRQGWRRREALVRVRWRAGEHRVTWHTVEGPTWSGEFALTALNGRRTVVTLTMSPVGDGLGCLFDRWFAGRDSGPQSDLRRLAHRLALLPQPVRPSRLVGGTAPLHDLAGLRRLTGGGPGSGRGTRPGTGVGSAGQQ